MKFTIEVETHPGENRPHFLISFKAQEGIQLSGGTVHLVRYVRRASPESYEGSSGSMVLELGEMVLQMFESYSGMTAYTPAGVEGLEADCKKCQP